MPDPHWSVADEPAKLAGLRDQGVITEAEFEAQKAHLLGESAVTPNLAIQHRRSVQLGSRSSSREVSLEGSLAVADRTA